MQQKKELFKLKILKRFKMSGKSLISMPKVTLNAAILNSSFTIFKKLVANYCRSILSDEKMMKVQRVKKSERLIDIST